MALYKIAYTIVGKTAKTTTTITASNAAEAQYKVKTQFGSNVKVEIIYCEEVKR